MAQVGKILDKRGYAGGERNRALSPHDVIWARQAFENGEVSARDLSQRFGMGIESVRRMLRGDTYGNVGAALVREDEVERVLDDGGALGRLLADPKATETPVKPEGEPSDAEKAVELFLQSGEKGGKDDTHE